jgi:hypothetical protein
MRTKIFNGLTGKREDFSLDPKFPKESLESFYRLGLYLVPTVLRRIEGNAVPGDAIINHSSKTHLMAVLNHIVSRQRSLKVILLGATPSRAFVNLFPGVEAGRKLAAALMKKRPVEEARKLTLTSPLRFQMRGNSWLDVWLSYWPRAQGVDYLSADILRVLDSQESRLFGRVCG